MTETPAETGDAPAETKTADPAYANYVLGVLFVVMTFNFLDRQIVGLLAEAIKADLGLTDTQIGLMTGLSFALFYTTLALPIAALADRWNRTKIISISIAVWSLMTVLCGMAGNFIQLFLARVGVGVGEAGSGPASHSLITTYFPPEKRAGALGIYGAAVPVGAFIAYAGGGLILANLSWREAFIIAGAPGIIIGIVCWLTVREPRGDTPIRSAFQSKPGDITLKEALADLSKKPAYWHLVASGVLVQFVAYGLGSFYGSLFVRGYGIGWAELGLKLGILVGVVGGVGAWLGGRVGNHFAKTKPTRALDVTALFMVLSVPIAIAAFYAPSANFAFILLAGPTLAATFYYGPNFAAIQQLASDRTRAMAVAIYLMIASLIGLGLGPLFVGVLSDIFAGGNATTIAPLRQALAILALFNIWGGLHFWLAARQIDKDRAASAVVQA